MSDDKNPSAGSTEDIKDTSGAPDDSKNQDQNKDSKNDVVPKSAYAKVSDDMHKFKRENADLKAKLAQEETDRLTKEKNFEQLWKAEKTRADAAEVDARKKGEYYAHTQKVSAIRQAALEAGLRSEAVDDLELLDFDGVDVELTSSGRYIVHGAKEFAAGIKNKKPHWFKGAKPPGHNPGGGGSASVDGNKTITPKDVVDAEKSWKLGKISKEDYVKVFTDYRTQKVKTN